MASDSFFDFSSKLLSELKTAGDGGFFGNCEALGMVWGTWAIPAAVPAVRLWLICGKFVRIRNNIKEMKEKLKPHLTLCHSILT